MSQTLRIWDLSIRIFHWSLIPLLAVLWATAEASDAFVTALAYFGLSADAMQWHAGAGYTMLGLLLYRLLWGMVGSDTARFSQFIKGPRAALRYVRGEKPAQLGHNPLGGWMVVAMLSSLLLQVLSGLGNSDDIFFEGPWAAYLSGDGAALIAQIHAINFNVLQALIALHLVAIAFYQIVKRERLITPMISGDTNINDALAPPKIRDLRWQLACALLATVAAYLMVTAG